MFRGLLLALLALTTSGSSAIASPSANEPATSSPAADADASSSSTSSPAPAEAEAPPAKSIVLTPKKGPRPPTPATATSSASSASSASKGPVKPLRRESLGLAAALAAPDLARMPRFDEPAVPPGLADRIGGVEIPAIGGGLGPAIGWAASLADPAVVDRRRRVPLIPRPGDFGDTLRVGERFRYDVTFAGNPTGIAEASIVAREAGLYGAPDRVRLEGFARTSGVVSLLTTLTYEMHTYVDAVSGAPLDGFAVAKRTGMGRARRRETTTIYAGRGLVEIDDVRVADQTTTSKLRRRIPVDTFDSLSLMAWVRALDLEPGERARAYGLDGKTLLRVDVTSKGKSRLDPMPGIATAIGVRSDEVYELEGTISRADRWGAVIPGKKVYKMRVWVSSDGRKIPLVLESDIWFGVVRLILTQYDPPQGDRSQAGRPQPPGAASASAPAEPPPPKAAP